MSAASGSETNYWKKSDLPDWIDDAGSQNPGVFPFLRGINHQMYTSRLWKMRQYAGFGAPSDTNRRWKTLIEQGQDGISCAFDLPTQVGYDADDERVGSDAGRLGVSVNTLDDFLELFDGIPLDRTAATFNINASAPVIYAMLLEAVEHQKADPAALRGTLSNDPLNEYLARGLWRLAPSGSMRLMADTFAYSLDQTPNFYPMNLRGTLVYEAGGTAVQEVAFAMACAIEYLDVLCNRGLDMEEATRRFSFLFFSDSDFLVQAAKFRAARVLWAEMVKDRYGVLGASGQRLRFTAAVGNFNLRAQHPELNIVRNTLGSLGAVLGGCQAMLVAGMDEAFEIPSERSSLLGLYTQQVIALESQVTDSVDPLGGSYLVERMTQKMIGEIGEMFQQIVDRGGAIRGIESGELQGKIADAAFRHQLQEESGEKPVVGVNTPGSEPPKDPEFEIHEHDPLPMTLRRDELRSWHLMRDKVEVDSRVNALRDVLLSEANSVPAIRSALRSGVTLGEIMQACEDRYGEFSEPRVALR